MGTIVEQIPEAAEFAFGILPEAEKNNDYSDLWKNTAIAYVNIAAAEEKLTTECLNRVKNILLEQQIEDRDLAVVYHSFVHLADRQNETAARILDLLKESMKNRKHNIETLFSAYSVAKFVIAVDENLPAGSYEKFINTMFEYNNKKTVITAVKLAESDYLDFLENEAEALLPDENSFATLAEYINAVGELFNDTPKISEIIVETLNNKFPQYENDKEILLNSAIILLDTAQNTPTPALLSMRLAEEMWDAPAADAEIKKVLLNVLGNAVRGDEKNATEVLEFWKENALKTEISNATYFVLGCVVEGNDKLAVSVLGELQNLLKIDDEPPTKPDLYFVLETISYKSPKLNDTVLDITENRLARDIKQENLQVDIVYLLNELLTANEKYAKRIYQLTKTAMQTMNFSHPDLYLLMIKRFLEQMPELAAEIFAHIQQIDVNKMISYEIKRVYTALRSVVKADKKLKPQVLEYVQKLLNLSNNDDSSRASGEKLIKHHLLK